MAHLTRPTAYDFEDSNIALLGSDLEKRVREQGGEAEPAWAHAGTQPGLQIWRIEAFHVVEWPKERYGTFYDGDSYIVLHTYKKNPESDALAYDLHFWLGSKTTQDEAGTAAYKTVELDDHLHGQPAQHREIQGLESPRFLSYFPRFTTQHGGAATGFHHVSARPPRATHRLYRIAARGPALVVREVAPVPMSLVAGDVFVLDRGAEVWQLNTSASAGREKFGAAEFVQALVQARDGGAKAVVFDEGGHGAGAFLAALGADALVASGVAAKAPARPPALFRLSDAVGNVEFTAVSPVTSKAFVSNDAFLLDHTAEDGHRALYVWVGRDASLTERRLALQYAQGYLQGLKEKGEEVSLGCNVVRMNEGAESEEFLRVRDSL